MLMQMRAKCTSFGVPRWQRLAGLTLGEGLTVTPEQRHMDLLITPRDKAVYTSFGLSEDPAILGSAAIMMQCRCPVMWGPRVTGGARLTQAQCH